MLILCFTPLVICPKWIELYLHKRCLLPFFSSSEIAPFSSRKYFLLRVSSLENIENVTADCYMNEVPSLNLESLARAEILLELRSPSLGWEWNSKLQNSLHYHNNEEGCSNTMPYIHVLMYNMKQGEFLAFLSEKHNLSFWVLVILFPSFHKKVIW